MTVRAEADPAHAAGHALIIVGGAAGAAGSPGFRIQRDAGWGDDTLGPDGWQGSEALLQPDRAEVRGADLVLHVGWAVCRHLEAGVFELSLPAADVAQEAMFWPDILPIHSGAAGIVPTPAPAPVAPPVPMPKPAVPTPPAPTPPAPKPAAPKPAAPIAAKAPEPSSPSPATLPGPPPPVPGVPRFALIGAGLVVAALIVVAGLLWMNRNPGPTQMAAIPPPRTDPDARQQAPETPPAPTPPIATPPPATPPPATPPVSLSGLPLPEVVRLAPNTAALTAEGERRLREGQQDDGLLLLEAAADRFDAAAAAALARLYDPVLFQPGGPIPQPDPRQAARYYRDAAQRGRDVAAPREALRNWLQTRVQAGDLGATLSLKDFWP